MGEALLMQKGEQPEKKRIWYYNLGEEFTDITGGWVAGMQQGSLGSKSKQIDHLYLKAVRSGAGTDSYEGYAINNPIDFSKLSKIVVECAVTISGGTVGYRGAIFGLYDSIGGQYAGVGVQFDSSITRQQIEIDVSSYNDTKYIEMRAFAVTYDATVTCKIYRVWGET